MSGRFGAFRFHRARFTARTFYHRHDLPMITLPGGRFGFSEEALERWIRRRTA